MVLADFCVDSTGNLQQVVGARGKVGEMAAYYRGCNGTDPFAGEVGDAGRALGWLRGNLSELLGPAGACEGDSSVGRAEQSVGLTQLRLDELPALLNCTRISAQYNGLFDQALCTDLFTGLFVTAFSFLGTSAALFGLACVASVTYQFFGTLWTVGAGRGLARVQAADGDAEQGEMDDLVVGEKGGDDRRRSK